MRWLGLVSGKPLLGQGWMIAACSKGKDVFWLRKHQAAQATWQHNAYNSKKCKVMELACLTRCGVTQGKLMLQYLNP